MLKQKTLKESFSLSGKGLHTGLNLTVTFRPAPENHGYKIRRIDLEEKPVIDAVADNVVETTRGTVIARGGVSLWLVPMLAWTGVCFGDPLAWCMADVFLIPAFVLLYRHLRWRQSV